MKMRLIVLLFTTYLCCESSSIYWNGQSFDGSSKGRMVRLMPRRFNQRIWKRQDDLGYLEQCSILQFWDKQIGRVNVLAFFDSSWQFSHRQATMLKVLRERFERTGFLNIQFFAVNASPDEARYIDRTEVDAEEETWKQISPSEADGEPPVIATPEALVEALGPNIYFIQDNDELQIWPKLRAFRDQILVIDRCGRLTYQVIVPWSILHFPYVKAAILSTYKDEPCGHCEFQESPFDSPLSDKFKPPTSTSSPISTFGSSTTTTSDTSLIEDSSTEQAENYHSQITESKELSTVPPETETINDRFTAESVKDSLYVTTVTVETENTTPSMTEEVSSQVIETESSEMTLTAEEQSSLVYQNDETTAWTDSSVFNSETESTFDTTTGGNADSTVFEFSQDNDFANFTTERDSQNLEGNFNATTEYEFETTTAYESDATTMYEFETTTVYEFESTIDIEGMTTSEITNASDVSDEEQISKTENPMTTEISNTSLASNESRFREADDIESIDARDVIKSRSTNARSVSPNDGSENHLGEVETSSDPNKTFNISTNGSDYLLPIRIIMRAPHVDEYSDRTMKAHEYLVLKTGEPDYHEHLEDELTMESSEVKQSHVRKKASTLSRTFGKDESPGLYGEVADYWRNFGNEQQLVESTSSSDEEEEEDDTEDEEQILEHDTGFIDDKLVTPISVANGGQGNSHMPDEEIEFESERPYDNNSEANEDVDVVDEEAKSKLIAHYSKLLPWLYYVLDK